MGRRFLVVVRTDGEPQFHPMKAWLRRNTAELPDGFLAGRPTSHQIRRELRKRGWTVEETDDEVHLLQPGSGAASREEASTPSPVRTPAPVRERAWIHQLVPRLGEELRRIDPSLEVRDGYRLTYSHETLSYQEDVPAQLASKRYETDLLIVERDGTHWTPRVVVEAKIRSVTTHDAITYSQKAATHKQVHPYLRYGIFVGGREGASLPGRLFRHGAFFDFMVCWRELEPSADELSLFIQLLMDEVAASRLLQELMFNTRGSSRASYSVLQRSLRVR